MLVQTGGAIPTSYMQALKDIKKKEEEITNLKKALGQLVNFIQSQSKENWPIPQLVLS